MTAIIRVLPEQVANRIAAGEVVERPASLVKELIENALDAGARELQLDLEAGGTRLVRLRDDGDGMSAEDLSLSILPHATSKIADVDDLFRVASFGFRGEALPSIAAVAELTITTRRESEEAGARLRVAGGEIEGPGPAGAAPGTTVEVRNLFFNVPARKHFLKQERTELGHCLEAVTRLLLPEPEVGIRVTHEGREVLSLPRVEGLRERLRDLFGSQLAEDLLERRVAEEDDLLEAWFGPPALVRGTPRHQYLFLNARFIRDRGLSAALREAYRGLVMPREYPVAFLFLTVDPASVDVNVHPTKTEVRFRDRDRLFRLVRGTLRDALLGTAPEQPLRMPAARAPAPRAGQVPGSSLGRVERELFPHGVPDRDAVSQPQAGEGSAEGVLARDGELAGAPPRARGCSQGAVPQPGGHAPFQIHRSYIVVETEEGLALLDQHALHERRIYEELLGRFERSAGEDQHLLVPDVVELSAADCALVLEREDELAGWGIRVESFGSTTLCVRSLPAAISHVGGGAVIEEFLRVLREGADTLRGLDLVRGAVANMACRAAVKFNDPLGEQEIAGLVAWWRAHPELRNCPHGRPVALGLSLQELELQFKRKV